MTSNFDSSSPPIGIVLLSALYVVLSPAVIFYLVNIYSMLPEAVANGPAWLILTTVILVLIYVAALYIALFGLLKMESWGWWLGILVFGISALVSLGIGDAVAGVISLVFVAYVGSKRDIYLPYVSG